MNTLYKSLLVLGAILSVTAVMAQPSAPPATPIDGGLGLLLAGGAAYGIKKLKEKKDK
ncbi:PID-CTERM protein-sorting domain-containing protein [Marinoscillum sp.]|uniref:PID-CTERM protein-sorting domain-containing protein n=1 Tax=Marinoscillum sp. TaxID=2024838 RepID=UPI003BA8F296